LSTLPQLPRVSIGKVQARAEVLGIIGQVDTLASRAIEIEQRLQGAGTRFESELLERHEARLRKMLEEIGNAAQRAQTSFECEFDGQQTSPESSSIRGFLRDVQEAATGRKMQSLISIGKGALMTVVEAVGVLSEKAYSPSSTEDESVG